jgi:multiple sugar transport system ATP-binding protein
MAEIAYEHVWKIYPDGTEAVHDFDLEIRDGELMVLVGPSGCGKTTALRMLAGLEEITEGEIRIGDRIVNDLTPKDRDIAMVFQSYALYPHMTVADNLAFGLKLRKLPKQEINERVQRAARILQIEEFLKRKPRALSGGQRQRVAMGRAIVREPEAFLMDEPLSNLDAKLRVQMRAEIHQLQRRLGVTTIYVTHDQVEAMTMGDRVAVMNAGHLQQVDTPQVLYDQPVNEFVAGFIGSPSINLVESELAKSNGHLEVSLGEHKLAVDDQIARVLHAQIRRANILRGGLRVPARGPGDTFLASGWIRKPCDFKGFMAPTVARRPATARSGLRVVWNCHNVVAKQLHLWHHMLQMQQSGRLLIMGLYLDVS